LGQLFCDPYEKDIRIDHAIKAGSLNKNCPAIALITRAKNLHRDFNTLTLFFGEAPKGLYWEVTMKVGC